MATAAIRQARASAPARQGIVQTLQLSHVNWPTPFYLTTWPAPFTATLEGGGAVTFQPYPFAVVLPAVDGAGQQNMQVSLTNADQAIEDAIKLAHQDPTHRVECLYREYLTDATDAPQSAPLRLSFESIQTVDETVTGVAGRSDVLNRRFPGVWYQVQQYPGLDR